MSVLCIEVFAKSRHQLLPDPEKDEITAIFFCYQNEDENLPDTTTHSGYYAGYAVVDGPQTQNGRAVLDEIPCTVVDSELDLINWLIDLVKQWDPDVLAGWELHNASWGYVTARAHESFSMFSSSRRCGSGTDLIGMDLTEELSRVVGGHTGPKKDFYSATHASTFKVSGRHVLNVWRICRSEINLTQYSFENVSFHLLHQRYVPYWCHRQE
jgi:DNA polymerase zeta